MRLIDADELLNKTIKLEAEAREQVVKNEPFDNPKEWHIWNGVLAERTAFKYDLLDAPTVDAEPIVRCKDCKWYHNADDKYFPQTCDAWSDMFYYYEDWASVEENGFCSFGERIEDEVKQDD